MKNTTEIVILGAGYGGILTAKKLARRFRNDSSVQITLIDRNSFHTMLTELHEVAAGRVPEHAIRISLTKIFAGRPVRILQDTILEVDTASRSLISATGSYRYDYLVLGAGSQTAWFGIPGAKENCMPLWSYEDAVLLKARILDRFRAASNEPSEQARRHLLSFVVVGCGFTGIEMAGELAEWRDVLSGEFGLNPAETDILAVDGLPCVLPHFPKKLQDKTIKRLSQMNVRVHTDTPVEAVGTDSITLKGQGIRSAGTVIWAAGVEGSPLLESIPLKQAGRRRIMTGEYLHSLEDDRVYVVGDNIYYVTGPANRPVPQMVENAEHSADTVAHNITSRIKGRMQKPYTPKFHGAMVCIGSRYGVAHIGSGKHFLSLSGFPALFVKHAINLVYFFQVLGFNKCWAYLLHEFFHARDNRSMTGGHLSKASPNFWLVPLRLVLGGNWLMEGSVKALRLLKNPTDMFLIPAPPAASVSGATANTSTPVHIPAQPVDAGSSATAAGGQMPASGGHSATASALPVPDFVTGITQWFMNLFFYADGSYTLLAHIFQAAMIAGEVTVGLCFLAGLFTAPAALVSMAMCLMIWASGMSDQTLLWYLAGAVAMVGGSGSTFGLDYYVLPLIKKVWLKLPFVKRFYLYTD